MKSLVDADNPVFSGMEAKFEKIVFGVTLENIYEFASREVPPNQLF